MDDWAVYYLLKTQKVIIKIKTQNFTRRKTIIIPQVLNTDHHQQTFNV